MVTATDTAPAFMDFTLKQRRLEHKAWWESMPGPEAASAKALQWERMTLRRERECGKKNVREESRSQMTSGSRRSLPGI